MAIIRTEQKEDYTSIFDVHQSAFNGTSEAELVNRLRTTNYFHDELSLVAEEDHEILGHILFTRIVIKDRNKTYPALALAPLGVKKDAQKQGIGRLLIEEGLKKAKYLGHKLIIVLGDPNFYSHFGFEPASRYEITPPAHFPEEAFLIKKLSPEDLDFRGQVLYPVQFNIVIEK